MEDCGGKNVLLVLSNVEFILKTNNTSTIALIPTLSSDSAIVCLCRKAQSVVSFSPELEVPL